MHGAAATAAFLTPEVQINRISITPLVVLAWQWQRGEAIFALPLGRESQQSTGATPWAMLRQPFLFACFFCFVLFCFFARKAPLY